VLSRTSAGQCWTVLDCAGLCWTPGSPESSKWHNFVNTCPNGASEESIGIYGKSRCRWTGRLMETVIGGGCYGRFKPMGA